MKKKFKREDILIIALAIFLGSFFVFVKGEKIKVKHPWYEEKYRAATLMKSCIEEIKNERIQRGIAIDSKYDINNTGIIGVEMSGITTTSGALESKRTSTNPNFAAVIVHIIKESGLKKGDKVAVNLSSSFPALNIGILSACEVLEIKPTIITSIGASTWGGNISEFTYLDMEEVLHKRGLISNKSNAISIGGEKDVGKDMSPEELRKILSRMKDYGKEIIIEEDLKKNIDNRYKLYTKGSSSIKAFINVGGNIVSFGNTTDSTYVSPGIVKKRYKVNEKTGLVQLFSSKDIPIIHILNIKMLANKYGLEIDPTPLPKVGEGEIYYSYKYPYRLIVAVVVCALIVLMFYGNKTRSKYD